MTVPLCIRQGSKRNDDWVSVEELDWSAERRVLIPAEHFWCDLKCRPLAKNSSPNTNDLYIWVQSFHTLRNCCNRCGNKTFKYINYDFIFVATVGSVFFSSKEGGVPVLLSLEWMYKSMVLGDVLKCMKWLYPYVQIVGVWWLFLAQGLHLKSHQRCSAGIRTWLSADQSSSSTLTESSFLFDPCLIHRDTVMLE